MDPASDRQFSPDVSLVVLPADGREVFLLKIPFKKQA
jgi:hypothetical protein